ncbi:MAG TPA: hypothetical protein VGN19_06995, partial [Pedococcus sp.]|nr:hypothetical protein [Pedococcus sp.]
AGVGEVAVVSADLRALDRTAISELHAHGVAVVGVTSAGEESHERRLRQLGLSLVLSSDLTAPEIDDALDSLASQPGEFTRESLSTGRTDGAVVGGPGAGAHPGAVERGRVIAVWGPTGAPGRSTVALNLAAELAPRAPTLLADCDTYGASLAQALGLLDEAPGMAAAARAADQGTLDLVGLARVAPQVTPGLRVLTGIPRAERWTELRAASVARVLDLARSLAMFVVVDCGFGIEDDEELSYDTLAPRRNAATLTALEVADELLVVGTADPVGLQRLVRAVQDLDGIAAPAPRVVVNRVRSAAVGSRPTRRIAEALSRFAGMDNITYLPWDQETLDGAMFAGLPLAEFAPQSELREALASLASSYAAQPVATRRSRRFRR